MDLQEIIKKFVSYDETRPRLLTPWLKDNKVYATNGHILLSCPSSYVDGLDVMDGGDEVGVDATECMCIEGFETFDLSLLSDAIKSQDLSYTIEPPFEECECCFGEGEYDSDEECDHCNSIGTKTVRCHECQGRGHSEKPNPRKGERIYRPTQTKLQLPQREIFADWQYLDIIQETMDFFKGTWTVANKDSLAPIHFKQNEEDIDIVLMPMRP
jgi:hypothetical protein